ncbi:hypothetical protein P154DRAFT_226570 [Amniculicola lignicola CBS 123094]|uniref:Uncharacterized protein n=1 Tax=Amniculicola lignicola CBS 123094 TaxID=1392246 RepID=A0A6A5WPD2_9PLEO|nr:hypothetical protein P154DRAFT_226570 [Amniculicola lignicola CBS 123094]
MYGWDHQAGTPGARGGPCGTERQHCGCCALPRIALLRLAGWVPAICRLGTLHQAHPHDNEIEHRREGTAAGEAGKRVQRSGEMTRVNSEKQDWNAGQITQSWESRERGGEVHLARHTDRAEKESSKENEQSPDVSWWLVMAMLDSAPRGVAPRVVWRPWGRPARERPCLSQMCAPSVTTVDPGVAMPTMPPAAASMAILPDPPFRVFIAGKPGIARANQSARI